MTVARRKRYEQITLAYVVATGGRLPERASDLLPAVRAAVPGVTFEELRAAVQWALRKSKREGVRLEATLREQRKKVDGRAEDRRGREDLDSYEIITTKRNGL